MNKIKVIFYLMSLLILFCSCTRGNIKPSDNYSSQSSSPSNSQDVVNNTYVKIVRNFEYFISTGGQGVEMKYDDWMNYDYDDYDDLHFIICGDYYESGLGTDGKTIDGYDNRNYSEDSYQIIKGKYDQIVGIFGFDDRTPNKASTDLIILEDGRESFRTTIDENNTSEIIQTNISIDTEKITFRFEINGIIKDRIPMIIFADIKARQAQS